jgi:putative NADH-flavin reductase
MTIVVVGPTGMIGSRVVAELERRGHDVKGVSRASGVDITDPTAFAAAVDGADTVIVAVAARGVDYTLSDVVESVIEGLRQSTTRRVVVVGGAGSLEVEPGVRLLDTPDFPDAYKGEAIQAADALGVFREVKDLDWTYVSPAAFIHPGERTGAYRLGGDAFFTDDQGKSEISAEDFAIAIADLLDGGHLRERVSVAW